MTQPHPKVLILGIGNLLWADEGFGVRFELTRAGANPKGTQLRNEACFLVKLDSAFSGIRNFKIKFKYLCPFINKRNIISSKKQSRHDYTAYEHVDVLTEKKKTKFH